MFVPFYKRKMSQVLWPSTLQTGSLHTHTNIGHCHAYYKGWIGIGKGNIDMTGSVALTQGRCQLDWGAAEAGNLLIQEHIQANN